MTTVHVGTTLDEASVRRAVYGGAVFVFAPTPASLAFVDFTRGLVEDAFGGRSPETAQHEMPVDEYVDVLARLKPAFIHHPESKRHLQAILRERGCAPEDTYFDVPRLRTSTSHGYLSSGLAYAFHAHRDTWYSAPMMQLNYWMPVYEVTDRNVMTFHERYFDKPVANSSVTYNYYEWNRTSRADAAKHVTSDTREQPKAVEPVEYEPALTIVPPVGGLMLFSGAQLHSTIPNTSGRTRISIDFRTVSRADVVVGRGAPNVDAACTGTTLRDYLQVGDLSRLPADVVAPYDDGPPADERSLIFVPEQPAALAHEREAAAPESGAARR